jgi:hypothetical protein
MTPKTIRLPGPTPDEIEVQVAEIIEQTMADSYDRNLGPRVRRDATDGSGLRVDFTYDETTPHVALEVTTLVTPKTKAVGSELIKLENGLEPIVSSEGLGSWDLAIFSDAIPKQLDEPLAEFLRSEKGRAGKATYSVEEAPDDLTDEQLRLLAHLFDSGVFMALRTDEEQSVSIFPPVGDPGVVGGFATLLRAVIAANVDKLREASPREAHLGVYASRPVSADPARTPPPSLPDGVDGLWVLFDYYNAKQTHRLWHMIRGEGRWHLLRHGFGGSNAHFPSDESS